MTNFFTLTDTNGVVQYVGSWVTPDVWPSVGIGMAVAFVFFGFGMVLRMAKRTGSDF